MAKKFKLMLIRRGKYSTYKVYQTYEEAKQAMSNLNDRFLSKAYKRAKQRGRQGLSHSALSYALSRTAIQY